MATTDRTADATALHACAFSTARVRPPAATDPPVRPDDTAGTEGPVLAGTAGAARAGAGAGGAGAGAAGAAPGSAARVGVGAASGRFPGVEELELVAMGASLSLRDDGPRAVVADELYA